MDGLDDGCIVLYPHIFSSVGEGGDKEEERRTPSFSGQHNTYSHEIEIGLFVACTGASREMDDPAASFKVGVD